MSDEAAVPLRCKMRFSYLTPLLPLLALLLASYALFIAHKLNRQLGAPDQALSQLNDTVNALQAKVAKRRPCCAKKSLAAPPQQALLLSQAYALLQLADQESKHAAFPAYPSLLQQAKALLSLVNTPEMPPLIAALNQALQLYQSTAHQMTALLQQLNTLENHLSQTPPRYPAPPAAPPLLDKLKHLLLIQLHAPEEDITQTISYRLLVNRVLLNLQTAQLAVLQHDDRLYHQALTQATLTLPHLPPLLNDLKEPLQRLNQITLTLATPPLTAPLKALETLMQQPSPTSIHAPESAL